jgi:hypothetical protein
LGVLREASHLSKEKKFTLKSLDRGLPEQREQDKETENKELD